MRSLSCVCVSVAILLSTGCGSTQRRPQPYDNDRSAIRNPLESQRLNQEAAGLIDTDPDRAEQLLREALAADLFNGPAHNNLGVIHLARGQLYEAATEFEWARKLMPGHPDPRLNLALALEQGGRIGDALESFDAALEVYPDHLPTVMALTRCQLRYQRPDDRTDEFLREIALRGDESWRTWARAQQLRRRTE